MASPDPVAQGCAWDARWEAAGGSHESRRAGCVERFAAWQPGPGSESRDPELCTREAWVGVERFRACMGGTGWFEAEGGRVPYARPGAAPEEAARAARACAEASFLATRYGRFEREASACLERRGWRSLPPADAD